MTAEQRQSRGPRMPRDRNRKAAPPWTECWSVVTATCAVTHHGPPSDGYHGHGVQTAARVERPESVSGNLFCDGSCHPWCGMISCSLPIIGQGEGRERAREPR